MENESEREVYVYIDGSFYPKDEAKISVFDHGFLYGDGVFEGIRVYNGLIFKLREHIERLYKSAKHIKLEIPIEKEEMINRVVEAVKKNGFKDAYIRLIVTRGIGDLGLDPRKCPKPSIVIIVQPMGPLLGKEAQEKGAKAIISSIRRIPTDCLSAEIKSLNYLNSILARIEANEAGAHEAIMLDKRGFVSEGTGDNVFIVKDNKIITPPNTAGILEGITRNRVMELGRELGYEVSEEEITVHDLYTADEVFLTGTAAEIVPVVEINGRKIGNGRPGPVTKRLMEEFKKITQRDEEGVRAL
ncbi:MAG TPA: branched-chain-amino-acid transaminase [Euryarchaeota archaeon]|nr:MAG: branched-chain amino acid aminotransferase [Thermococci archaeon]RLF94637.1 MAG: branched-chain amino acid aminotransferase [Thermococci archaeon]HDI10328.1 branched-chain-amino-acid transaminase [Euryarchaeota archaeon]